MKKQDFKVLKTADEGIVTQEEFDTVQQLMTSRRREQNAGGFENIFAGVIKCADCGYALRAMSANRRKRPDIIDCVQYTCMLHFRSLMNDYHLKDLSSKVKSVLHAKKKNGQYLAAYAPYGYRKSEEDRHKLVIDGESAAVVRQIFQMRQSGMAYGKIAAALNEKGILPPRWYWAVHYGNGSCKYICRQTQVHFSVGNIVCRTKSLLHFPAPKLS